jgi:hypothetical protein
MCARIGYNRDMKTVALDEKTREKKREAFLRIYANVPLSIREDVIAVLDDPVGALTWEVAYLEIRNRTEKGDAILQKLMETKIL